jgi:hypothetical protein
VDGFHVDPAELTHAAGMIKSSVAPTHGMDLTAAVEGGSAAAGDDAVADALTEFGAAWHLAVGILRGRSESTATGLEHAAAAYVAHDEDAGAGLKAADHG